MGKILNINYIEYSPATKSLDLFVAGCHKPYCKDCCNPELIDFANGQEWHAWKDDIDRYFGRFDSSFSELFHNANWVVIPSEFVDTSDVKILKELIFIRKLP